MHSCNGGPVGAVRVGRRINVALIAAALGAPLLLPLPTAISASAAGEAKTSAAKSVAGATKAPPKAALQPVPKNSGSVAEQYCKSVRDAASEARFAFQAAELRALGKEIDERVAKLEMRTAELKDWFARREEFARQASEQLVNIYAAMRPEAASEQMSRMDETTAAAILSRLEPRAASAILNDIPPEKAARLATILTGASRKSDRGEKS